AIATSAGNSSSIIGDALGTKSWALTVTAVRPNNVKSGYSNYGLDANIAAPGGNATLEEAGPLSTIPGGRYARYSGTSMASPIVAGVVGLVRSYFPEFTASDAYYQVVGTADDIDDLNPGYEGMIGGLINGYRALTETVTPASKISLDKVDFIDASGNNNGIADPGETVDIVFHIKNRWAPASGVTVKLLTEEGEDRLTINTSQISLDTLYGIQNANFDHTNDTAPFQVSMNSALPPSMIPMYIVVENSVVSDTFKFEIAVHPLMLFVDDHIGGGDGSDVKIRHYYEELFTDLGIVYSYWLNNDTISADYLSKFPIVFWACEWAFPSLAPEDRLALSDFLDNGGHLFVSGQDAAWDLADPNSTSNEYHDSGGESKTWLEDYMYVDYISDAGGVGPLTVADEEGFLDLPSFEFYLLDRGADNQYPDEIAPRTGAYALLNYSNGTAAAVGNDDHYSTVYFAFGGLEAITDYDIRRETAKQIVNHFAKLDVNLARLKNTESTGPFTVAAKVQTDKPLGIAELWYRVNEGSWQNLTMTDQSCGNYTVDIPAVTGESDIEYFAFFKTSEGLYNTKSVFKFHSGADNEAPAANALYNQDQSIDLSGVYMVAFALDDFVSVDTNNVIVHYSASTGVQDSVIIDHFVKNIWKGNIDLATTVTSGTTIDYHVTYSDLATAKNSGRYPEAGELTITVGDSAMIDNFETDIDRWINDDNVWSHISDSLMVYHGFGSLVTGNGDEYPQNRNTSLELHYPIDLSGRSAAWLSYFATLKFQSSSDSAFFEVKEGEGEWKSLVIMAARSKSWARYDINLTPYCGSEHEPLYVRFRFLTDGNPGSLNRWGLIVDDIYIIADRDFLAVDDALPVPDKFKLLSAYPNPFNSSVNIPYALPQNGEVILRIYNMLGQEVYKTTARHTVPGYYSLHWNGKSAYGNILTSGIYFIQMEHGRKLETSKILFLK
ncbi:S8 family serine peptidase, partial [bacterium]|nr:S8 family serine peptidase [bacterium]